MRRRHTIPSIFNLSMVDVLFCVLGCVTLLWLAKFQQEVERTKQVNKTSKDLQELQRLYKQEQLLTKQQKHDLEQLQIDLKQTKESLARQLAQALARAQELQRSLEEVTRERKSLAVELAALQKKQKELEADLARANELIKTLNEDIRAKVDLNKKTTARADDLAEQVKTLRDLLTKADTRALKIPALEKDLKNARDKLTAEEARALALQQQMEKRLKELAELTAKLAALEMTQKAGQKQIDTAKVKLDDAEKKYAAVLKLLEERLKQLDAAGKRIEDLQGQKNELERRFAGVTLTGKRVVFLVDMSGSMELVGEKIPAPTKWTEVRRTISQVMRSMADLEKYQVVGFSDRVIWVMGQEGKWLDYDRKKTPDEVFRTLGEERFKPQGGTNMYLAMENVFRMRAEGLDAVYLFSDGLPNTGEGLTDQERRTLTESQQGEKLSRIVRDKLRTDWNKEIRGQRVRINSIGFFFESPDVGAFLWALSRENDGSFVGMSRP